jgi:hypothetical protein
MERSEVRRPVLLTRNDFAVDDAILHRQFGRSSRDARKPIGEIAALL